MAVAEHDATRAAITERELDGDLLTPSERTLKLTVPVYHEGKIVGHEKRDWRIRGRMSTGEMAALLNLETTINDALESDDGRKTHDALVASDQFFVDLLRERNDAVPPSLGMDEQQVLGILAWIAGNTSVADAIAKALTAGVSVAQTADELEAAAAKDGREADGPPLASEPVS